MDFFLRLSLKTLAKVGFKDFFTSSEQINKFISNILQVFIVVVSMYLAIKIGNKLIEKAVDKQRKSRFVLEPKKAHTVAAILKSVLKYAVYFGSNYYFVYLL